MKFSQPLLVPGQDGNCELYWKLQENSPEKTNSQKELKNGKIRSAHISGLRTSLHFALCRTRPLTAATDRHVQIGNRLSIMRKNYPGLKNASIPDDVVIKFEKFF
ncbi:hypothetical protein AVEN_145139-1 [Araneus ventricosus]|uniref:Uncharacterized protein n=1 Tax=Araneus ventricosus TaxID=182803 RepID=A0A4Y2GRE0_ARAVE|nr:hypothetical protein AVEN_145139-1 [Araneus ventricosus]